MQCGFFSDTVAKLGRIEKIAMGYTAPMEDAFPMRINKYLARKKYCTRREADTLIEKGLVMLNGKHAVLGDKVQEKDVVEVKFRQKKYHYYAYNKPRGIITHSPQGDEKEPRSVADGFSAASRARPPRARREGARRASRLRSCRARGSASQSREPTRPDTLR